MTLNLTDLNSKLVNAVRFEYLVDKIIARKVLRCGRIRRQRHQASLSV